MKTTGKHQVKTHVARVVALIAAAATMLGASSCTNDSAFRVEAKVSRDSYATQDDPSSLESVSWMYPQQVGADAPALESKYYITLKVTSSKALDPGVITIVTSDSGMALRIVTVVEGSSGGRQAVYHIDTDGYTQYLMLQQPKDKRLKIYFAIGAKNGKAKHMFATELPERNRLGDQPQDLDLQPVESMPDLESRDPIKVQEWPSAPEAGIHPPAIARKQAEETSLYFCYSSRRGATPAP